MNEKITIIIVLFVLLIIGSGLLGQKYVKTDYQSLMPGQASVGGMPKKTSVKPLKDEDIVDVRDTSNDVFDFDDETNCMISVMETDDGFVNNSVEEFNFPAGRKKLCCREETVDNMIVEKNCYKISSNGEPLYLVQFNYEEGELLNLTRIYRNNSGDYCVYIEELNDFLCTN